MNRQAFDDHALWTTLGNLQGVLAGDLAGEAEEGREEIRFVHSVVQYIDSLRGTDPALVDDATLTSLNNDVTQGRDYLNSYLEDREANAQVLASSVVTSLTSARDTAIRSMPAPLPDETARAAQGATDRYRDAADAEISTLRERIEELKTQLEKLDEQRGEDAEVAQQTLTGLREKIAEGEQQVATQTTQLQQQIETQRTSFTEEVEQREAAFKTAEEARDTAAKEQRDQQATDAEAVLDDLNKHRQQAKELLDATSRDVISGDYRGWAKKQANSAFWWTVTTVVIGLITVAALVTVVLTAANDSVQFLLSKSTVGIIGLILAGYTARQAAEHRHEERTANRLALDLAALEPFLEHVENPEALRSEIAKRVFVPEKSSGDEPRFALGRRSMTMAELLEFAKILRSPQQPPQ